MKKFYGLPYKDYRKMVRGGNLLIKVNKDTGNLEHINRATGKTLFVDKNYVAPKDDNVRPPPGTEVKPPKTFVAKPPPKVAPTRNTGGGRGTGRVHSELIDAMTKKNPGFIWNSRTYQWEKDPNYKGDSKGYQTNTMYGLTDLEKSNAMAGRDLDYQEKKGFSLSKPRKSQSLDTKGNLMTNRASQSNLKIRKGQGKRKFRVKNPFVGGMGGSSNIGLS
jgi:hypothetical protein